MRAVRIIAALLGALTLVATAAGATGWKIAATATDNYPSASVDISKPHKIAVRAIGRDLALSMVSFSCDLPDDVSVASGQVYVLDIAKAKSCRVYASADHRSWETSGNITVQILKR